MSHAERIADLRKRFEEAMSRFSARVESTPSAVADQAPTDGKWSISQMTWHVAAINEAFAGLVDGSIPRVTPAPEGFVETPWSEFVARVPDKLEAPEQFHPPAVVGKDAALAKLKASGARLTSALAGLTPERGVWTVKSILGPITVYQVGEWATAHVIRHNVQAKARLANR